MSEENFEPTDLEHFGFEPDPVSGELPYLITEQQAKELGLNLDRIRGLDGNNRDESGRPYTIIGRSVSGAVLYRRILEHYNQDNTEGDK